MRPNSASVTAGLPGFIERTSSLIEPRTPMENEIPMDVDVEPVINEV